MQSKNTITITVMSPSEVVWVGEVQSFSATNSDGLFDVLPDHARFVTLIEPNSLTLHEKNGEDRSFELSKAVLFFQDNIAKIYIHQTENA